MTNGEAIESLEELSRMLNSNFKNWYMLGACNSAIELAISALQEVEE